MSGGFSTAKGIVGVETCHVCNRAMQNGFCTSEFCKEATDQEIDDWDLLKEGEFGRYPCADCGCFMEDVYHIGSHCSSCAEERRIEARVKLLKEVLTVVGLPGDLAAKIRVELSR